MSRFATLRKGWRRVMTAKHAATLILILVLFVVVLNIVAALGGLTDHKADLAALLDSLLEWQVVAAGLGAGFGKEVLELFRSLADRPKVSNVVHNHHGTGTEVRHDS